MPRQRQRLSAVLLACVASISLGQATGGCRRRIYMDLGANWANTLRLHYQLQKHLKPSLLTSAQGSSNCTYNWEIYSFEASPVMQPFDEAFVKHLNGQGVRPKVTVPPVGGSLHMLPYARHFGCPATHSHAQYPLMFECIFRTFKQQYQALAVDPMLNDSSLIRRRLDEAATPNVGLRDRYTFVPAAVGAAPGVLDLQWPAGVLRQLADVPRPPGVPESMRVQVIDWVAWLKQHFRRADVVVVKMDVEGAEHPILRRMMEDSSIELLDVLGMECHGLRRTCPKLTQDLLSRGVRLIQEASYSVNGMGIDEFSQPKDLMPEDPRPAAARLRTSARGVERGR